MTALYIISFLLLVVATIALLKLTPEQINKDINELFNKQQTLKDQALTARGKKKKNRILLELERMRRALQETGKEKQFPIACAAALLLMVAGCVVAIAIDNMFLIPVLAVAFALIPFAYLTKTIAIYETQVRQELETALSIITTSYIRSDNLVSAVQENLYANGVMDEAIFLEKTDKIKKKITELRSRRLKLLREDENEKCIEEFRMIKRALDEYDGIIEEFSEDLFDRMVECVIGEQNGDICFRLKGGLELPIGRVIWRIA